MSEWHCHHLDDSLTAIVISDRTRFLVRLREPRGQTKNPIEMYRGSPDEARRAGDRLVQAYYPHPCDEQMCGTWHKI